MVRRVHPTGEAFVVQEVFGLCPVPSGAEADESLHTRKERRDRARKNVEKNLQTQGRDQTAARKDGKPREKNEGSRGKSARG